MFHVGDTACQRSAINVSDRQSRTTPCDSGKHRRDVTSEIIYHFLFGTENEMVEQL